jgi:ubiquinone biosynthesis protein
MLKPGHVGRYKDLAILLVKHGRAGVAHATDHSDVDDVDARRDAERLADELERMGPTFVKLGQLLSTRADLLPPPYLKALARLQDNVKPFAYDEVEVVVSSELGVRMSKAFATFDTEPLASASLGQVHRAELRDGRPVVVKVQRPNIRAQILEDMDVIERIAEFADAHTAAGRRFGFVDMVTEFRRSLMAELDYRLEAANLETLGRNLADHDQIVVPAPVADYSTSVVLTMEYVAGRTIGSFGRLAAMELDCAGLAEELFSAYLDQILVDGFFHADPHPGNVMVTDDGKLALLDLGMVARVSPEMQDHLVKLLLAISEGHGQDAAAVAVAIGQELDDYDPVRFVREAAELIGRNQGSTMADMQAGALIGELCRIAGNAGLRLPSELTMLGKALLNLDDVARALDPHFDPNAAIERQSTRLMRRKLAQAAGPAHVMAAAMEAKEFAEHFPARVNKVMDALAEGELKLKLQGVDEQALMRGVQKLANRVTTGMVIASLVIGAALIMRIPTRTRLFGYPAIAIVLFLLAAASAAWLVINIQLSDLPQRRKGRHRRR